MPRSTETISSPDRPSLITALAPRGELTQQRTPYDRRQEAALVRAITDAGIRPPRKSLRAGDYQLGKLLGDGPGWQDFEATHVSLEKVVRRVRQGIRKACTAVLVASEDSERLGTAVQIQALLQPSNYATTTSVITALVEGTAGKPPAVLRRAVETAEAVGRTITTDMISVLESLRDIGTEDREAARALTNLREALLKDEFASPLLEVLTLANHEAIKAMRAREERRRREEVERLHREEAERLLREATERLRREEEERRKSHSVKVSSVAAARKELDKIESQGPVVELEITWKLAVKP